MGMYFRVALAGALLISRHAVAVDVTRDPSLDANLVTAATQLDRLALLPDDKDWLFDFTVQAPNYVRCLHTQACSKVHALWTKFM